MNEKQLLESLVVLSTVQLQLLEEIKTAICNASKQTIDPVDSQTMAAYAHRHRDGVLDALSEDL